MNGNTIAVRTVGTTPQWGQGASATWPRASPIKDAPGYKLYEVEVAKDEKGNVELTLYHFANFDLQTVIQLSQADWVAYKSASVLMNIRLPNVGSQIMQDGNALNGLKHIFDRVIELEKPDRFVITYAGHGDPADFMGGVVPMASAESFVQHLRVRLGDTPLILDFSTNCKQGFWDFAVYFYLYADYLIATEQNYGDADSFPAPTPSEAYATFWQNGLPTPQAFEAMIAVRENQWSTGSANFIAAKGQESFVVYDLHQFDRFMRTLVNSPGFTVDGVVNGNSDIGQYVLLARQPALKRAFESFRMRYVSNRNLFRWPTPTQGFGVFSPSEFTTAVAGYKAPPPPTNLAAHAN